MGRLSSHWPWQPTALTDVSSCPCRPAVRRASVVGWETGETLGVADQVTLISTHSPPMWWLLSFPLSYRTPCVWMVHVNLHHFPLMPANSSLVFLMFRGREALIFKPNRIICCKNDLEKYTTLYAWLVVQLHEFVYELGIARSWHHGVSNFCWHKKASSYESRLSSSGGIGHSTQVSLVSK